MIVPNRFQHKTLLVKNPDGAIYSLNEIELTDLQIRIFQAKESGWQVKWDQDWHNLTKKGEFETEGPYRYFDLTFNKCKELFGLWKKDKESEK